MKPDLSNTFRALRSRNFALFFTGQLISRVGMWMQRTAVIWVVYTITHSAFMIGVATFAEQFPSFLFSVPGGIVADRYNRYKILMITQVASALQAIALTILAFVGHYEVWQILALSVLLGIANAYDVPARQSMMNEIIDRKEDLPNAIALNSSLNNLARLIGPALSGFVLAKYGADYCFLSNAVSFIAVIGALMLIKWPVYTAPKQRNKARADFKEAIVYLTTVKQIGIIILITSLSSLLVLPYITLLPVYAKEIFKGDATTFGYLNGTIGIGALIGTFYLASAGVTINFRKILLVNTGVLGISLILFSFTSYFQLALLFAAVSGFSSMTQSSISNTIIQSETDSRLRGRVISFFAMAIFGMLPLGSLLVGAASHRFGPAKCMLAEGIISIIIYLLFYKWLAGKKPKTNAVLAAGVEE